MSKVIVILPNLPNFRLTNITNSDPSLRPQLPIRLPSKRKVRYLKSLTNLINVPSTYDKNIKIFVSLFLFFRNYVSPLNTFGLILSYVFFLFK